MEFMMNWRWLIATVIVFGGIAVIAAIVRWRDRRFMAAALNASTGGGGGTGGAGDGTQLKNKGQQVEADRGWSWWIIATIGAVIPTLLILLGFWQFNYTWSNLPLIGDIRLPFVIVGLALGYLVACFKSVKEDEYGVISFFGLMIKTGGSGLVFVPFLLCRLIRLSTSQVTIEIGGSRCPEPLMVTFADSREIRPVPN